MRHTPGFVLLSLALVPGCGSQGTGDTRVKVYPVEGKLLVLGRPAGDAALAFHAVDKGRAGGHCPVGTTRADGTYRLMTYSQGDGAPEGEYVVTLYWPHDPQLVNECACSELTTHDRLFGRYADPATSQLRATIRPERNEIVLHATVGGDGRGWNLPKLKDGGNTTVRQPDERDRDQ